MRTHDNLFEEIISFQNLLKAARLAQRNKRFKNSTAFFNMKLEKELWRLHEDLKSKHYKPGKYRQFTIYEPKKRLISAAPYRDRVLHHAVNNVLYSIFDKTFIDNSFATRMGKGTHAALDQFQNYANQCRYVLKCDVRQYFPNINHGILMSLIRKKLKCADTLWLIERILASQGTNGTDIALTEETCGITHPRPALVICFCG